MLGQVMRTVCIKCKEDGKLCTIGCFVEKRNPQKMKCHDCDGLVCPAPTGDYSTGMCAKCLKEHSDKKIKE